MKSPICRAERMRIKHAGRACGTQLGPAAATAGGRLLLQTSAEPATFLHMPRPTNQQQANPPKWPSPLGSESPSSRSRRCMPVQVCKHTIWNRGRGQQTPLHKCRPLRPSVAAPLKPACSQAREHGINTAHPLPGAAMPAPARAPWTQPLHHTHQSTSSIWSRQLTITDSSCSGPRTE